MSAIIGLSGLRLIAVVCAVQYKRVPGVKQNYYSVTAVGISKRIAYIFILTVMLDYRLSNLQNKPWFIEVLSVATIFCL